MIQILGIIGGIAAIVMGAKALSRGEIWLTKEKPLTGSSATIAGIGVIGIGVLLIGFCLIGIPLILGR